MYIYIYIIIYIYVIYVIYVHVQAYITLKIVISANFICYNYRFHKHFNVPFVTVSQST